MASAVANLERVRKGNERFNEEAREWDSVPGLHVSGQKTYAAILKRLNSQPNTTSSQQQVLEIGCGTGILSFLLAPHVKRIVAVDAAQGMIDVLCEKLQKEDAPKNILPLALLLEDPEDSALPSANLSEPHGARQKFDLITSHQVLHHIPDLQSVLTTMYNCLSPTGCVMLTDFEDFGPEAKRFHPAARMEGVARHGIKATDMEAMMREIGFKNVQIKSYWTAEKPVEKFDGEFGPKGKAKDGQGEKMRFPYVLCYGEKGDDKKAVPQQNL